MLAAPARVHALDQLGADVAREVEVDVGQRVHLLVEEAPDEEPVVDRVDVREPDQVADDRGDRGAAAAAGRQVGEPARDAGRAHVAGHLLRQLEHLVVDEEEAGEVVQLDQPQLLDELCLGLRTLGWRAVTVAQPFAADALELAERRGALGQRGRGQPVAEVAREVEVATLCDAHRVRRRLRVVAREALGLLLGAAQPELGVGTALGVRLVEGRAMVDRDQHVLQPVPLARVVVHVARADDAHAGALASRTSASLRGRSPWTSLSCSSTKTCSVPNQPTRRPSASDASAPRPACTRAGMRPSRQPVSTISPAAWRSSAASGTTGSTRRVSCARRSVSPSPKARLESRQRLA